MAKLSIDELIEAFKELSLIELSEFVKTFEETFDVTAAAPAAVAAAPAAGGDGGADLVAVGGEVFPEVLERLHIADLELRRPPDHEPSRDFPGERNFHDVSSDPTTQSCGHGYCNSDSIAGPEEQ